jgi:hypothetical protein
MLSKRKVETDSTSNLFDSKQKLSSNQKYFLVCSQPSSVGIMLPSLQQSG